MELYGNTGEFNLGTVMAIKLTELCTAEQPPKSVPYWAAFNDNNEFIAVVPDTTRTHAAILEHIDFTALEFNRKMTARVLGTWNNDLSSIMQVELEQPMEPQSGIYMAYWLMNQMGSGELHIFTGVMAYHNSPTRGQERVFILSLVSPQKIVRNHDTHINTLIESSDEVWATKIMPWLHTLRYPDGKPYTLLELLESTPIGTMHLADTKVEFEASDGHTIWDMLVTLSSTFDRMQGENIYRRYDLRRRANGPLRNELKGRNNETDVGT